MRSEHATNKLRVREREPAPLFDLTARNHNLPQSKKLIDCMGTAPLIADLLERERSETVHCYEDILSGALGLLATSPTARALIQDAVKQRWCLCLKDQSRYDYALNLPDRTITLDHNDLSPVSLDSSVYFKNIVMISLIKALRDVWQEKRNSGYERLFNPESVLLLERVRTADICVVSVLVAWELRGEGYPELWRSMLGSDESDLAVTFSNYLEREPCANFTHHALAVTFQQWFRDEARVAACEHEALSYLDSLVLNHGRIQLGLKSPTHIAVELFSCLPDRTAYLRGDGRNILRDPLYAGLNDPVNQTHLFQILHDAQAVYAGSVPFRNENLAEKIFPDISAETVRVE